ncbi:hypothetical protein A2763_02630 [Candidatus Kaiserbacteria bacterium RIFCSPHIGHO2_01_FULL_54_36]|uniref:Saccharopine dehydrogenase NADP binding domain-containing protein n=1 Tax=Candidatus Kaiserbacteria bacterium RIFCSPHIGHO2_01_FULL_54_36 TaxID=1798482 RepID=A0A1F6CNN2_9BACT|nr:MAG: hypothetical protein A2763_02630 [Candidatus Kaiserbacteria bacterium RIFCSPHIGHO2_01_FULL_54_36]OGG75526.1 MAG: hypothetical protein A3A41_00480 [Candidatus Kaiserbacteria bacterium RIFCSPLOWO2_01_FULL_54_22]
MRYDFVVVGANGIQGKIVARDLLEHGYSVLLCANDDYGLEKLLEHERAEFSLIDLNKMDRVRRALKNSGTRVIVNCSCDDFNLRVTKLALELGMNYIDLGSEEDMMCEQLKLHKDFKAQGLLAISGIGSTPGINNIMLRYVVDRFDTIDTVHLGFAWNSNMPAFVTPFSIDAIQYEFTENAKILENGEYVEKSPLEPTNIDYYYRTIGKQRTCYTKHIEHHTFYTFLKPKGIKNIAVFSSFPQHSYVAIRKLIELGCLSKEPIEINGEMIRPLDFTIEMLRRVPIPEGYTEKENIWLKVYGTKNGRKKIEEMDCIASTLPGWEDATCNVDTGFPTSILAQMLIRNEIREAGVFSPEFVVQPEPFFARLGERKIFVYDNGRKINGTKSSESLLSPVVYSGKSLA